MDYIVCNRCGCTPSKRQCSITSCSHVYCEVCLTTPTPDFCYLCKIPTKTLKLDKNLPKNVRKMFADIGTISADIQKRVTRTIDFQKFQKALQSKIENKKSAMRRDQISKTNKKEQEFNGQIAKLSSFEENNRKKLDETMSENEKLRDMIKVMELRKNSTLPVDFEDGDFFLRNTPTTSSCPSVTGSMTDNDDMFQFDLLGLNNRSNSSSSSSSSQSNRAGSLF